MPFLRLRGGPSARLLGLGEEVMVTVLLKFRWAGQVRSDPASHPHWENLAVGWLAGMRHW
jgi:hypothetical protein